MPGLLAINHWLFAHNSIKIARNPERKEKGQLMNKAAEEKAGKAVAAERSIEDVHRSVMEAIVDQRLLPGTRLNELAMCEAFGISRREMERVFSRLAFENMVRMIPNRGAFVASPDAREA